MKNGFKITGTRQVQRRLEEAMRRAPAGVISGLLKIAESVMDEAVKRVPVQTGDLRDSAYISAPIVRPGQVGVEIGFGTDHAVSNHEATDRAPVTGEPKFLEKAIILQAKGSLYKIAKEAERVVAGRTAKLVTKYPTRPKQ
jgi:hypothetical protein